VAVPNPWLVHVVESAPGGAAATGWVATVWNESKHTATSAFVWVICANVAS
jgi:hypothetical protein